MNVARRKELALLAAVGISFGCSAKVTSSAQGVSVVVVPASAQVLPNGTASFAAVVTGTANTAVTWSVREAAGGAVSAAGLYSAPGSQGTYHVVATSSADSSASGAAAVTVTPTPTISVTVWPRSPSLQVGTTLAFTAYVSGTAAGQSTAVTWSVQEAGGGTIDAAGLYTAPSTPGSYHVVATSVADTSKSDTATLTVTTGAPPASSWVVGYWNAYRHDWSAYPTPVIDYSGITHLAVAHLLTQTSGTFLTYGYGLSELAGSNNDRPVPGTATDENRSKIVTAAAHAGGAIALISIGGSDDQNFRVATNSTNRPTFIANLVQYMNDCGFDGVDIDWEQNFTASDYPQMVALSQDIKTARPGTIVAWALNNWGTGAQAAALAPYVDQLNVMTYDMGGTGTWYHTALYSPASNGATGWNTDVALASLISAAVPPSKIGLGAAQYGYDYPGAFTGPGQGGGGRSMANYTDIVSNLRNPAFQYAFDAGTRCPAVFDGATHWYGYEDEEAVRQKSLYAKSKGLGGVIIFVAQEGDFYQTSPGDATGRVIRNPLSDATKRYFLGRTPNPAPRGSTVGTVPCPAGGGALADNVVSISGLSTVAVWIAAINNSMLDTLFDASMQSPDTHAVPVNYTIDLYKGGTWQTAVTVTGNNLQHGMHVLDATGATQLRMRTTASSSLWGGSISIAVHDLSKGSDDSLLALGDSVAAMQQMGNGSGEGGRLGYEIAQRDPTRWPVVIQGGNNQAVIDEYLDTTTYGIPRIRYWLQRLSVKYVSLQIGHNDVNAMSQPATTQQLDAFQAKMERAVKECLALGRTVILPRLRWMDGALNGHPYETQNIEAWHARLDAIQAKYPSVLAGPDVYTPSKDRADLLQADGVHPNAAGVAQSAGVWQNWMMASVYTAP